ncbi:nascent polypeptide-associated complex subunit alpha, muscle-specific form-like [Elephas maximus indicus]|uniref:nascent polypeptide-associated complex subunit alpha, muscle-specific form-like n=1 Tax=Elephas maximus indicus TaxID=99487 RepID=UPI0021169823|nr:nascent polypeptide-associated complex subunit alpha, muscle-specific form-like [Elephas maximus indicus]
METSGDKHDAPPPPVYLEKAAESAPGCAGRGSRGSEDARDRGLGSPGQLPESDPRPRQKLPDFGAEHGWPLCGAGLARAGTPGLPTPPGLGSSPRRPPTHRPAGLTRRGAPAPPRPNGTGQLPRAAPGSARNSATAHRLPPAARCPGRVRLTWPERRDHIARSRRPHRRRPRQACPRRSGCRPSPRPPPPEAFPGPAPSAPALPARRGVRRRRAALRFTRVSGVPEPRHRGAADFRPAVRPWSLFSSSGRDSAGRGLPSGVLLGTSCWQEEGPQRGARGRLRSRLGERSGPMGRQDCGPARTSGPRLLPETCTPAVLRVSVPHRSRAWRDSRRADAA